MILLLLSVLLGYAVRIVLRDLHRFPWRQSNRGQSSRAFHPNIIVLVIALSLVLLGYYFSEQDHSEKLLQFLAGVII